MTTLPATEWAPRALAETYRLRWQVELVMKELKQSPNLEALNSKDRHAVQVFAWASLIARAMMAPTQKAFEYLEIFAEEILQEIRSRDAERADSLKRLVPLMAAA